MINKYSAIAKRGADIKPKYAKPLIFLMAFGAIGVIFIVASRAATPTATFEVESGSKTSEVSVIADATASGGSAIKFGGTVVNPSGTRPNATNTGFPTGQTFNNYNGPSYNSDSGLTYDGVNFPSSGGQYYTFTGNNLVFRNCRIYGGILFAGDNIRMEHCEIIGGGGVNFSGVNTGVVEYNNIHNFNSDGVHVTSDSGQVANLALRYNFVHTPTPGCGAHADGVQIRGVNGLNLVGNNFDMGPWILTCGVDSLNAAVYIETANGGNSNVTLDSNYLNGGGFILRTSDGTNHKFINNRFGPNGHYGVLYNAASAGTITQWTGNVMDANSQTVNP